MIPKADCETCHVSADFLASPSDLSSFVDYFRCPQCGAVWTQPKFGFSGERQIITIQDQNPTPR
jgi:hypothetical protein